MGKLCDHCGHELPNAAGPGLYCTNCGEPVNPPKRREVDVRQSNVVTRLKKLGYNCTPASHNSDVFIRLEVEEAEEMCLTLEEHGGA